MSAASQPPPLLAPPSPHAAPPSLPPPAPPRAEMDPTYHFSCQFLADLVAMNHADFIITSTYQEIAGEGWGGVGGEVGKGGPGGRGRLLGGRIITSTDQEIAGEWGVRGCGVWGGGFGGRKGCRLLLACAPLRNSSEARVCYSDSPPPLRPALLPFPRQRDTGGSVREHEGLHDAQAVPRRRGARAGRGAQPCRRSGHAAAAHVAAPSTPPLRTHVAAQTPPRPTPGHRHLRHQVQHRVARRRRRHILPIQRPRAPPHQPAHRPQGGRGRRRCVRVRVVGARGRGRRPGAGARRPPAPPPGLEAPASRPPAPPACAPRNLALSPPITPNSPPPALLPPPGAGVGVRRGARRGVHTGGPLQAGAVQHGAPRPRQEPHGRGGLVRGVERGGAGAGAPGAGPQRRAGRKGGQEAGEGQRRRAGPCLDPSSRPFFGPQLAPAPQTPQKGTAATRGCGRRSTWSSSAASSTPPTPATARRRRSARRCTASSRSTGCG
jgi:hypothetical protein